MKQLILSAVLLIAVIIGGILSIHYVREEALALHHELKLLEKQINAENWSQSAESFEALHEKWIKTDHKWSMLIDHNEIDYINMYLGELKAFIHTKDKSNALAKISSLEILVRHIPDKEFPSLKNIL